MSALSKGIEAACHNERLHRLAIYARIIHARKKIKKILEFTMRLPFFLNIHGDPLTNAFDAKKPIYNLPIVDSELGV
jgi:hypothetical protein